MRNNTLDALYRFERTTGKSRFDCVASTKNYLHFEQILLNQIGYNKGGLSLHLTKVPKTWNKRGHSADQSINKKVNITSLYLQDLKSPDVFYGDAKGTNDALIVKLEKDGNSDITGMTIYVAKGLKNIQTDVCFEIMNGGLDAEIEALKTDLQQYEIPNFKT